MFNYNIFKIILPTALIINLFSLKNFWIGLIFGFAFLFIYGYKLGGLFFRIDPRPPIGVEGMLREDKFWKLFFGIPLLCATIILISTPIYYFYQFNNFVIAAVLVIISLPLVFIKSNTTLTPQKNLKKYKSHKTKAGFLRPTLTVLFLVFESILFYILCKSQTVEAIRTPWQIIDEKFLILYFLASLILVSLFFQRRNNTINLILLSIHSFLTLGLGLIIYKIGYGFDPFVHRATENLIYEFGAVAPKPFYYIGQYTLVVFLSKILMAPLAWIDKLILPIFTAIFLPPTIYWSFKNLFKKDLSAGIVPILFLTIPLTGFVATTPQGLANFFVLFLIFLSLGFRNYIVLTLIALAVLMIHPLAGIPALIFVGFCRFTKIKDFKLRCPLLILLFFVSILIIPSIFIIRETTFSDAWQGILKSAEWGSLNFLAPSFENRYGVFPDFVYFYKNSLPFIIIILSGIGVWVARKHKTLPYFLIAVALATNTILLKMSVNFKDVIDYEQADYANRLLQIAGYFLLPLCLFALAYFFKRLVKTGWIIRLFFILVIASLATFSIYLTYPRVDRYDLSHNINTSLADINAVHFIEENSSGENYIVLANQAVSAAALQEFGFEKYFKTDADDIFYYPIPTGGKLYKYYLDMVYKEPSRGTMINAMNLVGVKQGYFVLNKYWTNSERIFEKAKEKADSFTSLDNDKIFVLKYIVAEEK